MLILFFYFEIIFIIFVELFLIGLILRIIILFFFMNIEDVDIEFGYCEVEERCK